jgi:hypothetical protein
MRAFALVVSPCKSRARTQKQGKQTPPYGVLHMALTKTLNNNRSASKP